MKFPIVSYIKDSTKEYEGEFSLVLFCYGCNFNCVGCYNAEHVIESGNIIGDGYDLLDELIDPLTTAIVLIGGEPTIHSGMIDVLRKAKNIGLKTKIFTNGTNYDIIMKAFNENILDQLSIDLKAIIHVSEVVGIEIENDDYLHNIEKIISSANNHNIETIVHTTLFPSMISQIDGIAEWRKKHFPNNKHKVQRFIDPSRDGVN